MTERDGKKCPLPLFVWVDMEDEHVFIGHALIGDQTAIGCVKFDSGGGGAKMKENLKIFATTYWSGLIDNGV